MTNGQQVMRCTDTTDVIALLTGEISNYLANKVVCHF